MGLSAALAVAGGLLAAVLGSAAAGAWRAVAVRRAAGARAAAVGAALGLAAGPPAPGHRAPAFAGPRGARQAWLGWRPTHSGERVDHKTDGDGVPVEPGAQPRRLSAPLAELHIGATAALPGPGRLGLRLPPGPAPDPGEVRVEARGGALTVARRGPLEVGVDGLGPEAEARARAELDALVAELGAPAPLPALPAGAPPLAARVDALAADPERWAGLARPGAAALLLRLLQANAPFEATLVLEGGGLVWSSLDTDGLGPGPVGAILDDLIALIELLEQGAPEAT